jgi:nucleolar protein 4
VEDGVTVFIRGLPLDLVKDQLYSKMKTYGRVRSCRLVKDKTTGKLKGTAFVDFVDTASAEKVTEVCSKWRSKQGPGVIVAGIVVECDLAVNADAARDLAVAARGGDSSVGVGDKKGAASKRNLHLSKEGVIVEASTAWQDLSESDKAKRKRAQEEKKTKLVSPNFIISPTRLSVRNIPRSWTEKQLKALFIQGVKERSTKANPKVVQVKILTSESAGAAGAVEKGGKRGAAAGAAGGESKSKGIGFVEFADHEHALCALRQLNNNPKIWGKDRRPIIEFAIDNVKMLKAREANLAKQTRSAAAGGAGGGDGDRCEREAEKKKKNDKDRQDDGPKSKRKLRKERGEMLKQRAKEQGSGGGGRGETSTPESTSSKSQRRREQRKKAKGVDAGAGTGGDAAETSPVLKLKAASGGGVKPASTTGRAARTSRAKIRKAAAAAATPGSGGGGVRADQKRHTRRERQDALVDKLATLPKREMAGGVKKRRGGVEKQDGLDKLAKSYFGGGDKKDDRQKNKKKTTKAMEVGKAVNGDAFKRWFE